MNNLVKRILGTIAVTAAVALSGFILPETVLLPDLSVTASAENTVREVSSWGDLSAALQDDGSVKLTGNVTAGNSDTALEVPAGKYVTLDLNGYKIDRGLKDEDAVSGGNVITVNGNLTLTDNSSGKKGTITGGNNVIYGGGVYVNGGKFTMSGGKISGCSANGDGGGVFVDNGGEFTMSGGTISGCSAPFGGGVYVYKGTFTMSGGTISDCDAGHDGGGVCVDGTFTMSGGTISGCSANGGGGVLVNGTFTMSGGEIRSCSANGDGGGVSVCNRFGATFTMSGGTICGCSANGNGGVYVDGTFNVSGKPVISGNKKGDAENNVVFASNHSTKTINVTGELTTGASIYVTAGKGDAVAVGGGYTLKAEDAEYFHSDSDGLASALVTEDNTKKVKFVGAWVALQSKLDSASTSKTSPTTITLSGDVKADSTDTALEVPAGKYVILNLNGNTINRGLKGKNAVSGGNVITVNGNLTLTDSSTGEPGTITGGKTTGNGGGVYVDSGTFTMSGGTISGCSTDGDGDGGGVYVNGGEFTMSGGTISGCSTYGYGNGGGVYVHGTFTMTGGTISDCSAVLGSGGGVFVNSTFTMSGGTISSCSAKYDGGGVYVSGDSTFTMSGGEIRSCSASSGGGVSVDSFIDDEGDVHSGTFNISGSPVISGNKKGDGTNNVEFASDHPTKTIKVTGALTTGASVYVHAGKNSTVAVGSGYTLKAEDAKYFHSDYDGLASALDNGNIVFMAELPEPANIASVTYNGNAQLPELNFGSETLTKDTDYTVTCKLGDTVVTEMKNAGTYTFTITGIGAYVGTYEKSYTINKKPVTVTADNKTKTVGENDPTLTAAVTGLVGSDTVNYTLSRASGETVGTYTITPSGEAEQGNYTVTYKTGTLTIKAKTVAVTGVTLDKTTAELTVNEKLTLTATVKPDNATDKTVTWTSDYPAVATVSNGVVTAVSAGKATITATAGGKSETCVVTVKAANNGGNNGGNIPYYPTYPTGGSTTTTTTTNTSEPKIEGGSGASGWSNIASEIGKTPEGGSVVIDMGGVTTVPANVLNAVKGKDVDLVLDMGGGVTWTINGKDISSVSGSIDLGVKLGTSDIPVEVKNNVTSERYSTTLHLNHSGKFGFKAVMTVPLRKQDAGLIANLFYYNLSKKALEFVSSAKIDANGNAELDFNHASDYAIVIDDHSLDNPQFTASVDGSSVKLTWDAVSGAAKYNVYVAKNGKWSKLATTKKTMLTVAKLKNNKTYKFLVRAKVNGKLTPVSESYKLTVKVCYKPVLKATTKNGTITLKWSAVNNATEYRVVKYTNGEWKLVKETSKLSQTIRGLKSGKTYKYAVQAKVNGKWTTIGTTSTATVKVK